jgi:23S rRNA (uracil1939-C5)-methyltransferase
LDLRIEKLIYGGDGLARLPADDNGRGKAVFLPFVLAGERVDARLTEEKPGFARATPKEILETSPHRIEARCPYFRACGGCQYQHSSYSHQLDVKASILRENLRRIAKVDLPSELGVHPSPPWNYRNRTRLRVRVQPAFELGYFKFGSHELLAVEECPISSPTINKAIQSFWQAGRGGALDPDIREIELFADAEDQHLLIEAFCSRDVQPSRAAQLAEVLRNTLAEVVGVTVFRETADAGKSNGVPEILAQAGASDLSYKTAGPAYRVSAGSFFQTNRYQTDELVGIVTSGVSGRTAIDLYAGVGLFTVVLSREFERVVAVEASQQSHADLVYNSPANVKTVRSTVDQYLKNAAGRQRADLIVVDPPRGGLGEGVAKGLAALETARLTYVSCDPATLARDLVPLLAGGYHIEEAHLVDLFPQTFHLESVLHLVR